MCSFLVASEPRHFRAFAKCIFWVILLIACHFIYVFMFRVDIPKDTDTHAIKQNEFEGTWYVVSTDLKGKTIPTKTKTESVIVFRGNEFLSILDGKPDTKATLVTDPSKRPRRMEIDCGTTGKIHAIYEFKPDGTLRLALIGKDAPESFETKGNYNRVLNLKRVSP